MPLTHEEILALKKKLDERYDNRYVQISDCNDIQEKNTKRFSNDDKRIEIISHDFGTMKKLLWAVASASIGSLVVAFFELVLK